MVMTSKNDKIVATNPNRHAHTAGINRLPPKRNSASDGANWNAPLMRDPTLNRGPDWQHEIVNHISDKAKRK